jgi:tetratricopeptide (TPR) repeat protein
MLGERRARVHAAVARAIESRDGEPLDERAALLASHWEQAGEELAAARWHRRAAEWAGVGELAESSHHWARVWEIARALPESEETVGLCYAAALQISNYAWRGALRVDPRRVFEEARELGERQRNDGFLAMLHMVTAAGVGQTGDLRGYVALADEALAIARRTGSEDLVRMAQLARSFAALFQGRLATAHAIFEAEIGLGGGAAADFLSLGPAFFHGYRAMLLINLGHFEEGERELRTGIDLARELGDIDELAMFQYYSVVLKEVRGDLDGIVEAAHQAVALGERGGGPYSRFWSYDALALAKRQLRDWSGVAEAAQTALEVAERYRTAQPSLMFPLVLLAQAALELGEPERARRLAEETVERADAMGVESPLALRVAASILIRTEGAGAADRAGELLDRAWRYAQEWPSQQPDIELERAELARVLGDEAGWRRCIRAAHRLHAERGAHPHAARLVETYPDAFGDQAAARSS